MKQNHCGHSEVDYFPLTASLRAFIPRQFHPCSLKTFKRKTCRDVVRCVIMRACQTRVGNEENILNHDWVYVDLHTTSLGKGNKSVMQREQAEIKVAPDDAIFLRASFFSRNVTQSVC